MADLHLICEGLPNGVDVSVLNAILAQVLRVSVIIDGAGGETSVRNVRGWREESSRKQNANGTLGPVTDVVLSVLDRNFRPLPEVEASWKPDSKCLRWRRHEIENYLLEPRVVLSVFDAFRRTVKAPWVRSLPASQEGALALLASLAEPMRIEHAARVLHWELRARKRGECSTELPPLRLEEGDGTAEVSQDAWVTAVLEGVRDLKENCEATRSLPWLDEEAIRDSYGNILDTVEQESFLQSGQFLKELDGKKLLARLCQYLHQEGAAKLSRADLVHELVEAITRECRPGLFNPDDFGMLARRLEETQPPGD